MTADYCEQWLACEVVEGCDPNVVAITVTTIVKYVTETMRAEGHETATLEWRCKIQPTPYAVYAIRATAR